MWTVYLAKLLFGGLVCFQFFSNLNNAEINLWFLDYEFKLQFEFHPQGGSRLLWEDKLSFKSKKKTTRKFFGIHKLTQACEVDINISPIYYIRKLGVTCTDSHQPVSAEVGFKAVSWLHSAARFSSLRFQSFTDSSKTFSPRSVQF